MTAGCAWICKRKAEVLALTCTFMVMSDLAFKVLSRRNGACANVADQQLQKDVLLGYTSHLERL